VSTSSQPPQPTQLVAAVLRDTDTLPLEADVTVYHGDSWALVYQLADDEATAHDLTGATIASSVVDGTGTLTALVAQPDADPTTGQVTITPPAAGLAAGVYRYDLEVTDASGVLTWVRGQLAVQPDVTP
jgi:hypothetical protein